MSNIAREIRDGKHYVCFSPDGVSIITVSKTPRSPRRVTAYRDQFRRLGVDC